MKWALENPDASARTEKLTSRGRDVPDHLIPPAILPGYESWWSAFSELSTDRAYLPSGHPAPIPAWSIDRYSRGWSAAEVDLFRRCIRAMDGVYLAYAARGGLPEAPASGNDARDGFRAAMARARKGEDGE